MNSISNTPPLYETNYLGFWIKVFLSRIEFKAGAGTQNIPINQIASVQLGMIGYMQIVIETSGGKKYKIPCLKKKEVKNAIYQAQEEYNKRVFVDKESVADHLTKLVDLKEKGILTAEEFEKQKKKALEDNL